SISWPFWCKAQVRQMRPQCIDIRYMEDEPTPLCSRLTLFQIENGGVRISRAERGEARPVSAIQHTHAEHVTIEMEGSLHVSDSKRHGRDLLNSRCHRRQFTVCDRVIQLTSTC